MLHLLKEFFAFRVELLVAGISPAAVRFAESREAVVIQQIADLHQQMVRRGDIGLAMKGAQISPGCRVFGACVIEIVHQNGLAIDGVFEDKFRCQDFLPPAEGLYTRNGLGKTDMNPPGVNEPALQKLKLGQILRIAVGAENDPIRLACRMSSGSAVQSSP